MECAVALAVELTFSWGVVAEEVGELASARAFPWLWFLWISIPAWPRGSSRRRAVTLGVFVSRRGSQYGLSLRLMFGCAKPARP